MISDVAEQMLEIDSLVKNIDSVHHESMDKSRQIPATCSHNVNVIAENIVLMEIVATAKSVSPFISFAIT